MDSRSDINIQYKAPDEDVEHFRKYGFTRLKGLLSPRTLNYFEGEITQKVLDLNPLEKSMEERDTYQKAFLQVMNLWRESRKVKELVFSTPLNPEL